MFDKNQYCDMCLVGLNTESKNTINKYFQIQFNRFLFIHSTKVLLNGKEITEEEKILIRLAFFNIKPKSKIEVNKIAKGGIKLTERMFIENVELPRIEAMNNLDPIKKEQKRIYIEFLKNKLKQLKEKEQEEQKLKQNGIIKNKYPHIFGNDIAYTIFNEYLSKGKLTKANYSFLYRKMFDEELINETVKVSGYISFLNTHLNIDIDKIKTIHQIGSREDKEIIYYQIKEKYIKKN